MTVLVTGVAGFIGAHVAKALMERGDTVIGIDDFNDYYDPQLKEDRIRVLLQGLPLILYRSDIRNVNDLNRIFSMHSIDGICHLAARAGVRASLENPRLYYETNVLGTFNMFEQAIHHRVKRFVFASSSSVYGSNTKLPFSEDDPVDHPVSPYAATKKDCELMAHVYHHIHGLPVMGLRFFTVYGPWGRPDMAYFSFVNKILRGQTIDVYNHGEMRRDFTYIDDIVRGIVAAIDYSQGGYQIVNLGNHRPELLINFIETIEHTLGCSVQKQMLPMQPGDVLATYADITKAKALFDFEPTTSINSGIPKFIEWYKEYYHA